MQGGRIESMGKFLDLLLRDTPPEKAFQEAFQSTYAQMEKELRKYVSQGRYMYTEVTFKNKLTFDSEMQTLPLEEADSNAYLGDLLYHTNRADDAEAFLVNSIKLKPDASMTNTTLAMVKLKQRKWDEARAYLEKAIAQDQKNHMAFYRYAYLLSREGRDEFGFVREFEKETAAKIRESLKKAIAINPAFTESYDLLAFVSLVNRDEMDEAVAMMLKALKYQPGNQKYALRIAEIYFNQGKLAESTALAEKIARTADDGEVRSRADSLTERIRQRQEIESRIAGLKNRSEGMPVNSGQIVPVLRRRENAGIATPAELAKATEEANIRSINETLRTLGEGESRVLGVVKKIECKGADITYTITAGGEEFTLTSKDFEGLFVNAFVQEANSVRIGCDEDISAMLAAITYKPRMTAKSAVRGDLIGVEFVPKNFRLMTSEEMAAAPVVVSGETISATMPPPPTATGKPVDLDAMRRNAMMQHVRSSLREPQAGEKREMAFLDKIECTNKGVFFHMRTGTGTLKLSNSSPEALSIRVFTGELEGLQFGCGIKPVEVPAFVIYTDKPNSKSKSAGEILSLDFVPKSFTLN
jgi:tetratricopeptide (TPR) repeat protein